MALSEIYTLAEAAKIWGISRSHLRNSLNRFGKFDYQIKSGTVKKSGDIWLVSHQAMREVFGPEKTSG